MKKVILCLGFIFLVIAICLIPYFRSGYHLDKPSENRWRFEDLGPFGSTPFISLISANQPSIWKLEKTMMSGKRVKNRVDGEVRDYVVEYYKDNYLEIRERMRKELFFGEYDLAHINRLYPLVESEKFSRFDTSTFYEIIGIHFFADDECVVEVVLSWDDSLLLKYTGKSVTLDHTISADELYSDIDLDNHLN